MFLCNSEERTNLEIAPLLKPTASAKLACVPKSSKNNSSVIIFSNIGITSSKVRVLFGSSKYNLKKTGVDNFRYSLLSKSLKEIGIDGTKKEEVKIVRPSDIMKILPVITSLFNKHRIIWGDNPLMRWFTNNAKLVDAGKGNYVYDKIEPKSRKTDGFMAFVHAMIAAQDTLEDEENQELSFMDPLVF